MTFPAGLLNPGEEVVADVRPHWWYLAGPVGASLAALAGAVVTAVSVVPTAVNRIVGVVVVVAVAWLVVRYARWHGTRLLVTTSRLVHRQGVMARRSREIPLDHLGDVGFRQSIWQRALGAGDLMLGSVGRDSQEVFSWLPHPGAIESEIYRRRDAARVPVPSVAAELERLEGLRRRGVLSEIEFQQQKDRLLRR